MVAERGCQKVLLEITNPVMMMMRLMMIMVAMVGDDDDNDDTRRLGRAINDKPNSA